jgi:hypothetical protein
VLNELVTIIDGSALQRGAFSLLSGFRAAPPLIQTVHILGIAAIMGSTILLDLRLLGLALRSRRVSELIGRLMPWTWTALPFMFMSGIVFVLARPQRYAMNPVFRTKFMILLPAILVTLAFHLVSIKDREFWEASPGRRAMGKVVGAISLALWLGVMMAGRWIAYADYLIPVEE